MGDPEIPRNNAHPAQSYGLRLCKAAMTDDWPAAAAIFRESPAAISAKITSWGETALHLAVGSNSSHKFVANLLGRSDRTALRIRTDQWNNALHYAAKAGNLKDAMVLVDKDPTMTLVYNLALQTPLHIAAACGRRETFEYLLIKTESEMAQAAQPNNWPSPFSELMGLKLVVSVIEAEFYDLALKLLKDYPTLATQEADEKSALTTLATKQTRFGYGQIGRSLKYRMIRLMSKNPAPEKEMVIFICDTIIDQEAPLDAERMIKRGIFAAIENGTYEFIKECLIRYPITLWSRNDVLKLFISSIKYRQREVFDDLVRYTTPYDTLLINGWEYEGGNVLHLVAHLPRYDVQAGGAQTAMHLQIIREVRWYQAVEKMIDGPAKKALNRGGKTPRMVFLEEHKDMNQKLGDWAIQVAAAGTVVAALVFTASIHSLLNQNGPRIKNVHSDHTHSGQTHRSATFLIFNATAFFFSTLSMILFMYILTKRYNADGILTCMPRTLGVGVFGLYQSIIFVILMAIIMMAPEKSEDVTFTIGLLFLDGVLGVVFTGQLLSLIRLPNYGRLKSSGI